MFRVFRSAERMSLLVRLRRRRRGRVRRAGAAGRRDEPGRAKLAGSRPRLAAAVRALHGRAALHDAAHRRAPRPSRLRLARGDRSRTTPVVEVPLYSVRAAPAAAPCTTTTRRTTGGRSSSAARRSIPPLVGYLAWELRDFPERRLRRSPRAARRRARLVVHPNLWTEEERPDRLAKLRELSDRLEPEGEFPPVEGTGRCPLRPGRRSASTAFVRGGGATLAVRSRAGPRIRSTRRSARLSGDAVTPHEWGPRRRDPATVWRTDRQLPGLKLEIDLGREETVAAVSIAIAYPHDEFPRGPDAQGEPSRRERFARVFFREDVETKWELVDALVNGTGRGRDDPPFRCRCAPGGCASGSARARDFDYALPDWSTPEIRLYRRCE